jgi:hypothetical protein
MERLASHRISPEEAENVLNVDESSPVFMHRGILRSSSLSLTFDEQETKAIVLCVPSCVLAGARVPARWNTRPIAARRPAHPARAFEYSGHYELLTLTALPTEVKT